MGIIPKPIKPLSQLTTYEREKEVARLRALNNELIDEMGQESDKKALSTVRAYTAQRDKTEKLTEQIDIEALKKLTRNKKNYQRYLLTILNRFLQNEAIPKKYKMYAQSDDNGIVLGLQNTPYLRAIAPTGIPKYDLYALKILAVQTGNTVARMEGHFRETDSGIALANKQELQAALTKTP